MRIILYILSLFVCTSVVVLEPGDFYLELKQNPKSLLLDVRIREQYDFDHIPNAVWAGEKDVLMDIIDTLDKHVPIFVYCEYGDRTQEVIPILKRNRFRIIYDLKHGYGNWVIKDYPIVN